MFDIPNASKYCELCGLPLHPAQTCDQAILELFAKNMEQVKVKDIKGNPTARDHKRSGI